MASDSPNKSFINVDVVFLGVGAAFCAAVWFFLSATLCLAMRSWVAFVVDVALSAVPGGGTVSGVVGPQLKGVFGNNPKLDGVIDEALKGADTLSTAQTDALKKKLTDSLNGDQQAL